MNKIPYRAFDLCLTDPPYGVGYAGWDYLPSHEWLLEARRLSDSVVFTPGVTHMYSYPRPDWTLCWARPASVQRNGLGGFNNWEPFLVYGKTKLDNDLVTMSHGGREVEGHPCPKPSELFTRIIEKYSAATVLDPFLGSGTTAVAAKKLGRHFLGFEISEEYCRIARERLARIDAQPSLFTPKPEQLSFV